MTLRFQLLGPVEACDGDVRIDVGAAKVRTVLATLLLARGRVVLDSRIATMLWGEAPPATADAQIRTYISRLRGKLGRGVDILRQHPGYLLPIRPEQLDVAEFERLTALGRAELAAGRHDAALRVLRSALNTWRGPALTGVTEFLGEAEQLRLEEARLAVLSDRIGLELALGQHNDLVAELTGLVMAHPLQEGLRAHLMTTLHRCGRRADALSVYHDYRCTLAEELGIDPGRELQNLYQTVLADDATLDLPVVRQDGPLGSVARAAAEARPAQLPSDIADFTGRRKEVSQLVALLSSRPEREGHRVGCVLGGMAGVGKTALAVHVAHRVRKHYPNGQIYIDLRGYGPSPTKPNDALLVILRALGVDRAAIPPTLAERVTLYRSQLSGRRVLVVLDNAATEQRVRPLLPDSPGCSALVTGRALLGGLEGMPLIDLGVLAESEALELLARISGLMRVSAEDEGARRIVRLCGYLPLGMRIAGARLAVKPHWSLMHLANLLSGQQRRLDELRIADLEVRASVALSVHGLGKPARRAFRLLALLDLPRFAVWTAAVLLDVTVAVARDLVEHLVDNRLLEIDWVEGTDHVRYSYHDLVRLVALELAAEEETAHERYAALDRALGARWF